MDNHGHCKRKTAPGGRRYASERGQALAFTLVFAAATGLVSLLLFNSGMLANTKTRLQNAADAGAYSAALLQARDHNFSAYTNRAMVANQVAVAQLVSLKSYLEDAAKAHDRMDENPHTWQEEIPRNKSRWDGAKRIPIEAANSAYSAIAGPSVRGIDRLIQALETAQNLHHTTTMAEMMVVADEVVKRNDPQARVASGTFQLANGALKISRWNEYTKRHRANDASAEADRFADVVVDTDSTDRFTRNRISPPFTMPANWSSEVRFCFLASSTYTAYAYSHHGGTMLSSDKRRWLAMDTTMGLGGWSCTYTTPWGNVTIGMPLFDQLESGGAVAGSNGDYEMKGYKNNPWMTWGNGFAVLTPPGWSRYSDGPGASLDTNGGLQDNYRDIADTGATPANQTPEENGGAYPITIEVERPGSTIRTSSKLLTASANVRLDDGFKGDTMRTLSSAHAYFYRSNADSSGFTRGGWRRGDGKTEMANLFNPYWQARLTDPSLTERIGSRGAQ